MNTQYMEQEMTNPLWMIMKVLNKIMAESLSHKGKVREQAIPIKGFTESPSSLRKIGINLLVTLEDRETTKEHVVPFAIDEDYITSGLKVYGHERRSSWRGRQIHRICSRLFKNDFDRAYRKVKSYLKMAWNRFIRKINAGAKRARRRARRGQEGNYRFERARICCH